MTQGLIDVHHHAIPPFYVRDARQALIAQGSLSPKLEAWTPAASLEAMDRTGIGSAVLSISSPGVWFGDAQAARRLSRQCNEYCAVLAASHPQRFGFFAAVPLPDIDGSLVEIRYAFDELKADGVCLMTSYADRWPGDPAFAPVFDELDRRKAVVFVHPTAPCACQGLMPGITPSMIEFPFDTVRAIVSLLFSGTLSRCRAVRFIFAHAGGALPSLAERIKAVSLTRRTLAENVPEGVAHELARLYYDLAIAANPAAIDSLSRIAPVSQMLLGTDYPFRPIEEAPRGIGELPLSPDILQAIGRDNALALLPRLDFAG